ncbi:nucleotidyltransferase domain-containing protein [Paenibacillus sp. IB182496]|uniref:Nucleotidyltransferase domain-containing protein n=1 Tax=Paenibacillus sabuli TaxID=2772509 RepID=A0A927BWU6_9BACL|nr:nucleotidyltransferase domain-containing protein [Paenibacillus sabuli]MBD2847792.1 nucleotidyltransferase domain-containing protein [Paenibacillus sabuli]
MNIGLSDTDIQYIRTTLSKFEAVEKAVLFGSRAKGNYKRGSDIDLAVYGDNIDVDTLSKLHALLEDSSPMPYLFDIVDGSHLTHKGLLDHIERIGKIIYTKH